MSRKKSRQPGFWVFIISSAFISLEAGPLLSPSRPRCREIGIEVGILEPGPWNAITDVSGVRVGHTTLVRGDSVRTGVTAILPHGGNLYREKVPGAVYVGNGYGKLAGGTQVGELGEIETPVVLTNTLSVSTAMRAVVRYTLGLEGNEGVFSVNAVVGETNDGGLNDIRGMHVEEADVMEAILSAETGPVDEGCVGAGTGTSCFGFKGGIGTASRALPETLGGWTVGVLVQTNFGGVLTMNGAPVGRELGRYAFRRSLAEQESGSCMIVVATDAPLLSRNLRRLAARAVLGLARCGGFCSNGSGDYAIAFSTHAACRIPNRSEEPARRMEEVRNDRMSPLFLAAVEATEEAVYNSMLRATTMRGLGGRAYEAIPVDEVVRICEKYRVLNLRKELPHSP